MHSRDAARKRELLALGRTDTGVGVPTRLIITTKIFWGGDGVNEKGLSRKHCLNGIDFRLGE